MLKLRKTFVVGMVTAMMLTSVLSGCGQANNAPSDGNQAAQSETPQKGGTFRTWSQDDPKSLDPAHCGDTVSYDMQQNIYDGLLMFDKTGKQLVPDLASALPVVSAETVRPIPSPCVKG